MVGSPPLRVQLITKPGSRATGIGRYAHEIEIGLRQKGVNLRRAELQTPLPGPLIKAVHKMGYDLRAFSQSYPLRAGTQPGYVTHLTNQTLATLLLTQRLPRPVVITVHDILPYLLRDDPSLCVYRHRVDRVMDALAMHGLKRADRLVAISHHTKKSLVEHLQIPPDRIDVIHNGVDPVMFSPRSVPDQFYRDLGIDRSDRIVLHVGSEDPRKGIPLLLEALAIARQKVPDVVLLKVGLPAFHEQRERNQRLCERFGVADIVKWIGEVSEVDLPFFYNAADVLAFPSLYEGFGFPVVEAMACGTPVVAFRRSSLPEIAGDVLPLVEIPTPEAFAEGLIRVLSSNNVSPSDLMNRAKQYSWNAAIQLTTTTYLRSNG